MTEYPQFFTATVLNWYKLLRQDAFKDIILDSLRFLVASGRIYLYAYVIMENHMHLIWQMRHLICQSDVQRDFLRFTAQQIKTSLSKRHPEMMDRYLVNAADRRYQFWQRNSLSVELRSSKVFIQKLNYIHWNPVRAGICAFPEDYKYSSALFYETGIDNWGYLTHYAC